MAQGGEAVQGQEGGDIILGTQLGSNGRNESVVTKMVFNYFFSVVFKPWHCHFAGSKSNTMLAYVKEQKMKS